MKNKMKYLIYTLVIMPIIVSAQPNKRWYKNNDKGNRYEGTYIQKVSNLKISLAAFSTELPNYEFDKRQKLELQFFSPNDSKYKLRAEELRISKFYWMEDKNQKAKEGWNSFNNWPVDYYLKRLSINKRNLGLLAHIGKIGERTFAPVFINIEDEITNPEYYIAQIRLGSPVANGKFIVYEGKKNKAQQNIVLEHNITKKSAGTVFPIVIPIETLDKNEGWFTVEIGAIEERTEDAFSYSFSFYHQNKNN